MAPFTLYLASTSPRRLELLRQIHIEPRIQAANIDETPLPQESVPLMVQRLARTKAQAVARQLQNSLPPTGQSNTWVLGADTAGVINNQILSKPGSKQDALRMWQLMSGRVHQVITAISLVNVTSPEETLEAYSTSEVEFDAISTDEMEYYWQSGEPRDKAGAYAIQGYAACWVKHLSGSYSGVMGLPLCETRMLLKRAMVWHR